LVVCNSKVKSVSNRNACSLGFKLDLRQGFTEEPPFPGGFDVVISAGVISFSPDQEKFLSGLDSMVRQGGALVIADVNPNSLGMRFRRRRRPLLPLRELNGLSADEVSARLASRGYRIEERRHYQLTLPVPYLLHLSEARLKGLGSGALLAFNRFAHGADAKMGARFGFLFDSYYARRTGRRTTGNASRSGDSIGVGGGNRIWQAGTSDPAEIVASVPNGLYLTDLMGFGINQTTGDFSRGAAGVWIENGQLAYPVVEINVSGNLKQMLRDIDAVGNDLQWLAGGAAPTIRMSRLTVSGL